MFFGIMLEDIEEWHRLENFTCCISLFKDNSAIVNLLFLENNEEKSCFLAAQVIINRAVTL